MFTAAKDIWLSNIQRNIAAMAENCRECTAAGKNRKIMCSKEDLGTIPGPKKNKLIVANLLFGGGLIT